MEKEIICTVCPMGCHIRVTGEGDRIDSIEGFTCKRGEAYGRSEFSHPVRILTSTVKLTGGEEALLPVRSSAPVPKESLFECMTILKNTVVSAPVKCHDVVVRDIAGTGIDIIASSNC
ncbi:MAG: DUF1667 domain-containing protein [Lachnospiraceae bacterium]|nr:DUF1667 domain-containing protein [Lachnospiraceae bacterium]MBR4769037.1 DUF1667 domain-containing protein [Lachnospiraceae bacterium]